MEMHPPVFDLQSHSRCSDGALSPAEVVTAAAAAGVQRLALSDHDTTEGLPEARQAARASGVTLIDAVEISVLDPAGADLHLLGYLIDPGDAALSEALRTSRGDRERRARAMGERLRALGFALDDAWLAERTAAGRPIGRPHLAEAVVRHPANRERLSEAGELEPTAFLVAHLIEGTDAFVAREAPSVEQAITLVHGAGGVAIWAHPFWDVDGGPEVLATIDRFRAVGLDGIEAFYPTFTPEQTDLLVARADREGLLTTGSADFHGPEHRTFARFRDFSLHGHAPRLGPIGEAG